ATLSKNLDQYRTLTPEYIRAEDIGMRESLEIKVKLRANVDDLARLVSAEQTATLMKIPLSGLVCLGGRAFRVKSGSALQMFDAPWQDRPERFFRYSLLFDDDESLLFDDDESRHCCLEGVKVLSIDSGLDIWLDTATLYFDIFRGQKEKEKHERRGILRLSLQDFLQ